MTRLILHQTWNQRRQNLWIWVELAVLSAFLWLAVDPLFTMVCIKNIPCGFERDRICLVKPIYGIIHGSHETPKKDSGYVARMDFMLTQLQAHPMVEAVCLGNTSEIPGGINWNGGMFYPDFEEAKKDDGKDWKDQDHYTHAQWFQIPYITGLEKWTDVPGVLGLRDAFTGKPAHGRPDGLAQELTYVSAGMARRMYGTPYVQDSTVYENGGEYFLPDGSKVYGTLNTIAMVYADIKGRDYETPYPSLFKPEHCDDNWLWPYGAIVRVKPGVDMDDFRRIVQTEVLSRCITGPIKEFEVTSLEEQMAIEGEAVGANNVVRLQAALSFFGLMCVFLGVSGLFWVRCGERRQDMGVMRAMGATRRKVTLQMLLEAMMLLVAAFVPAMMFVAWYVHGHGYDTGLARDNYLWKDADMSYWFNRPVEHLTAVTLLTFALMVIICLLATWVPVHRAGRVLPSDALHDE